VYALHLLEKDMGEERMSVYLFLENQINSHFPQMQCAAGVMELVAIQK